MRRQIRWLTTQRSRGLVFILFSFNVTAALIESMEKRMGYIPLNPKVLALPTD